MRSGSARKIDLVRRAASERLDPQRRAALGQFMTPSAIAEFMASLFQRWPQHIRLLDPGAGVGSLTHAFANRFWAKADPGSALAVTAYEIDPLLQGYLAGQLRELEREAKGKGHRLSSAILENDFIVSGGFDLSFGRAGFTHVIMNPPYKKISSGSEHRHLLRRVGVETVNLYTAFLAIAVGLTETGGEIVAIVPRSFCNG